MTWSKRYRPNYFFVHLVFVFFSILFFCGHTDLFAAPPQNNSTENLDFETDSPFRPLDGSWEYKWEHAVSDLQGKGPGNVPEDEWNTISGYPKELPGREGAEILHLRTQLPQSLPHNPVLFIERAVHNIECTIDGEEIYRFGTVGEEGRFIGFKSHLIPLEARDAGKTISIHIYSVAPFIGLQHSVYVDSRFHQLYKLFRNELIQLVCIGLFLFLGLLSLVFLNGPGKNGGLYFALFTFLLSVYVFHYLSLRDILIDLPLLWYNLWGISLVGMPVALLGFFRCTIGPGKRNSIVILHRINIGFAALVVAILLFGFLLSGIFPVLDYLFRPFLVLRSFLHILILVDSAVSLHQMISYSRGGNRKALVLLIGFGSMVLFILYEILAGLYITSHNYTSLLHWGMLIFVYSNIHILIMENNRTQRRIEKLRSDAAVSSKLRQSITDEMVLLADTGGTITMTNPLLEQELDYSKEELIGSSVRFVLPDFDHIFQEMHSSAEINGEQKSISRPCTFVRRSGGRLPASSQISIVLEEGSTTVKGLLFVAHPELDTVLLSEHYDLSDREIEIMEYVRRGFSNEEIAEELFISTHTVRAHLTHIYSKMGIHSRSELTSKVH